MIDAIAQLLTTTLAWLHRTLVPDWGLAILLLTLLVRAVIWPLTKAQIESMKKMQALAPQVKALEEKFPDDKEKRAQEMMRIYTVNKVNPLSGCLPVLIQMPILIGMFIALRDPRFTKQLPGFDSASFLGMRLIVKPLEANPFPEVERLAGMLDLASLWNIPFLYDRFLYLPSMGLFLFYIWTSWVYSKQMQAQSAATMDPNQKMMSNMMMFLLMYFGLIFPVGLLLYFVASNLVQMGQQALTPKAISLTPEGGETPAEVVPASGGPKKRKEPPVVIETVPEQDGTDPKTQVKLNGKGKKKSTGRE